MSASVALKVSIVKPGSLDSLTVREKLVSAANSGLLSFRSKTVTETVAMAVKGGAPLSDADTFST